MIGATMVFHIRANDRLQGIGPRRNFGMTITGCVVAFQLGSQAAIDLIVQVIHSRDWFASRFAWCTWTTFAASRATFARFASRAFWPGFDFHFVF